jgi:F-type H+-transporting ATPase subunit gamma
MPTTEILKRKIDTAQDLHSVVKTMKALSAVTIRQYEKAVASLGGYDRTLQMGLQILLKKSPQILLQKKRKFIKYVGLVVFGSDQGMCGQFNDRIAQYTLNQMESLDVKEIRLLTVGTRIRDRLAVAKIESEVCFSTPSSVEGITPVLQEIVVKLEQWRTVNHIEQILVFYNYLTSTATYHPNQNQIFPLSLTWLQDLKEKPWKTNNLPTFTLRAESLGSALFRQYFFVSLYGACAESLASENASRLASMQMAEKNIDERLGELQAELHHQRQTIITEELLDIVAGFEALRES